MGRLIRCFWTNENGATAIEYGLIATGIAVAIMATVYGFGTDLQDKYTIISNAMN